MRVAVRVAARSRWKRTYSDPNAVLAQPRVELRPGVIVAAMRAGRLRHRVRNELETLLVGFDAGREFTTGDRTFDQQDPHDAPDPVATPVPTARKPHPRPTIGDTEAQSRRADFTSARAASGNHAA